MPKIKTNRSAAKRFSVTGAGRIVRNRCNKRHILTKKSPKRKRRLGQSVVVAPANVAPIRRLLPYLF